MKPVVAEMHETFFNPSETFIYNYIAGLKEFHPLCLARNSLNLENFPFPKDDAYILHAKRYSLKWFKNTAIKILSGKSYPESIITQKGAKLIHAHFGPSGFYAVELKKKLGLPLVTSFYGQDVSEFGRNAEWIKNYEILFKEGDMFLAEGPFLADSLEKLGCPRDKIRIQRIGIPIDRIKFEARMPKHKDDKVILVFTGRFVEKKGLEYALKALKTVEQEFRRFEFRIIGDGPLKKEILHLIESRKMGFVKLLGFIDFENYLKEMSLADIFIHPSVTASSGDNEGGAPTTILEAQALGLPVISTFHADIPSVVVQDKSALLSKERDEEGLAKNILCLLKDQGKWREMGYAGRKFVEEHHDINVLVRELEDKYRSLISF